MSVHPCAHLPVSPSVYASICSSIRLSNFLFVQLSVLNICFCVLLSFSIQLSVCSFVHLFISLSVFLSVLLSVFPSFRPSGCIKLFQRCLDKTSKAKFLILEWSRDCPTFFASTFVSAKFFLFIKIPPYLGSVVKKLFQAVTNFHHNKLECLSLSAIL